MGSATVEKAKKLSEKGNISDTINCYVTDEQEALLIMERLHSGEDKGRGIKQWNAREKEQFKVRQNRKKNIAYLIDYYSKMYFDGFDITSVLPFTTLQRLFNNKKIKKQIGLDVSNEASFTAEKMQLIIDASKWVVSEAKATGAAVTRLFNEARVIEDKLIPWIQEYTQKKNIDVNREVEEGRLVDTSGQNDKQIEDDNMIDTQSNVASPDDDYPVGGENNDPKSKTTGSSNNGKKGISLGGNRNLPYFFQGLNYSRLSPNDPATHGVTAVCRELQLFSDKRLVATYPIATTFLVRSLIEQSIIYYSKKHNIQGQNKLIWENIKDFSKLSKIIDNYNRNLPNYITDSNMRQYFTSLFADYESDIDPLNWVVHRPAEFRLSTDVLVELPRKGLLSLVNYMLS